MDKVCYRELHRYKYQLVDDFELTLTLRDQEIDQPFIQLSPEGLLTVRKHYAWDGPSGPTIDTPSFMRGSLVHDALYQLMRLSHLEQKHREFADDLMKQLCIADGMLRVRAWYVHKTLRLFGAKHAAPVEQPRDQTICVP